MGSEEMKVLGEEEMGKNRKLVGMQFFKGVLSLMKLFQILSDSD